MACNEASGATYHARNSAGRAINIQNGLPEAVACTQAQRGVNIQAMHPPGRHTSCYKNN